LCSDAFTSFDNIETYHQNAQNVKEATQYLYNSVIPEFSVTLQNSFQRYQYHLTTPLPFSTAPTKGLHLQHDAFLSRYGYQNKLSGMRRAMKKFCLSEGFHAAGINCRHIGRVRKHVGMKGLRHLLLATCVSRVIKRRIEEDMRLVMQNLEVSLDLFSFYFFSFFFFFFFLFLFLFLVSFFLSFFITFSL
jgi:hypothetical protein